jgi:hypothetical protein
MLKKATKTNELKMKAVKTVSASKMKKKARVISMKQEPGRGNLFQLLSYQYQESDLLEQLLY